MAAVEAETKADVVRSTLPQVLGWAAFRGKNQVQRSCILLHKLSKKPDDNEVLFQFGYHIPERFHMKNVYAGMRKRMENVSIAFSGV